MSPRVLGPRTRRLDKREGGAGFGGRVASAVAVVREAAIKLEVHSYLSARLFIDRAYHGSLNLYGEGDHGFRELDAALLELYTTAAEAALRRARRYRQSREHVAQLQEALTSRAVIDQAKGSD
jgi:hypothetical protein